MLTVVAIGLTIRRLCGAGSDGDPRSHGATPTVVADEGDWYRSHMEPTIPSFPGERVDRSDAGQPSSTWLLVSCRFFVVWWRRHGGFFATRYRRVYDHKVGHPIEGSLVLELLWSGIPFVIVIGMFVWGS